MPRGASKREEEGLARRERNHERAAKSIGTRTARNTPALQGNKRAIEPRISEMLLMDDALRAAKTRAKTAIFLRLENFRSLILMGLTWNSNSRFAIRNLGRFGGFVSPTLGRAWAEDRGTSWSSFIASLLLHCLYFLITVL